MKYYNLFKSYQYLGLLTVSRVLTMWSVDFYGEILKVLRKILADDTLQPLYNTVRYNMVLDITQFKDRSQKCIDYIEKWP